MKTITLHVTGTHCASCKILIEDILNEQIGIERTQVNLKQETVSFETNLDDSQHKLAEVLTEKVHHNGYSFSVEKKAKEFVVHVEAMSDLLRPQWKINPT